MTVQNYWFWQIYGIVKNSTRVDLMLRTIFGPKLAAILDFEPLGDLEIIFESFDHILYTKNIYLEKKVVYLWYLEDWVWNIPFLAFHIFFVVAVFENAPGEGVHPNIFLLKLQIIIL